MQFQYLIFVSLLNAHADCEKPEHLSHNFSAIHIQRTCQGAPAETHAGGGYSEGKQSHNYVRLLGDRKSMLLSN